MKTRLHILIPSDLKQALKVLAKRDGVTLTAVIVLILWGAVRAEL